MPTCRCVFHAAIPNVMDSSTTIVDDSEDGVMEEEESGENCILSPFELPCVFVLCIHILHLSYHNTR